MALLFNIACSVGAPGFTVRPFLFLTKTAYLLLHFSLYRGGRVTLFHLCIDFVIDMLYNIRVETNHCGSFNFFNTEVPTAFIGGEYVKKL